MSATRAALVFFRGVPAAMTSARAIPSLSYLCFYNGDAEARAVPCGLLGSNHGQRELLQPPKIRWALGLLYKDVSFMFIQDQSGGFWAAWDPFSNQALAKSIHLLKQIIMKDMKAHIFGITLVHSFLILSLEPTKRIKMTWQLTALRWDWASKSQQNMHANQPCVPHNLPSFSCRTGGPSFRNFWEAAARLNPCPFAPLLSDNSDTVWALPMLWPCHTRQFFLVGGPFEPGLTSSQLPSSSLVPWKLAPASSKDGAAKRKRRWQWMTSSEFSQLKFKALSLAQCLMPKMSNICGTMTTCPDVHLSTSLP